MCVKKKLIMSTQRPAYVGDASSTYRNCAYNGMQVDTGLGGVLPGKGTSTKRLMYEVKIHTRYRGSLVEQR